MEQKQEAFDLTDAFDTVAVALSGGSASGCLLKLAVDAVGAKNVVAITLQTELTSKDELELAAKMCDVAEVEHCVVSVDLLSDEKIAENGNGRCYLCKTRMINAIRHEAWLRGIEYILDGTNLDDSCDCKAGAQALSDNGVICPFLMHHMTKSDISRLLGADLPAHDKKYRCAALNIEKGTRITFDAIPE